VSVFDTLSLKLGIAMQANLFCLDSVRIIYADCNHWSVPHITLFMDP